MPISPPSQAMASGPSAPASGRVIASVTVSLPPERVFGYLEHPALRQQWIPGLEDIVFDQPGIPRGVGTRFRQRIRIAGRSQEYVGEVTAYRPPVEAAIRLSRPWHALDVEYRLTAVEGGTRVEQLVTLTVHGWLGRWIGAFAAGLWRRRTAQGLARLKAAAEAGTAGGP